MSSTNTKYREACQYFSLKLRKNAAEKIKIHVSTIDGSKKTKTFNTKEEAKAFLRSNGFGAHLRADDFVGGEIVSEYGDAKARVSGISLHELFADEAKEEEESTARFIYDRRKREAPVSSDEWLGIDRGAHEYDEEEAAKPPPWLTEKYKTFLNEWYPGWRRGNTTKRPYTKEEQKRRDEDYDAERERFYEEERMGLYKNW